MGQNCERFIDMCLESVKDADAIVYCCGTSIGLKDESIDIVEKQGVTVIQNTYNQEDPKMNGKQRNFYLKYLKKNYPDWWTLCLDADEVVEDLNKIKEFIQTTDPGLYSVKMRHLIQDLTHEDAIQPEHYVLNRLFKISEAGNYPEAEHPVLEHKNIIEARKEGKLGAIACHGQTDCTTIWHLAYIPNLWELKKRYENHLKKSNMHTPEFLKGWYKAHLFGRYPVKQFNPVELPKVILDNFGIDKDELYFEGRRQLEAKHYQDAIDWKGFFGPKDSILWGCGFGQRVRVLRYLGVDAWGYDLSKYAIENGYGDIVKDITEKNEEVVADLVVAYDILEHIPYNKLDIAIENLMQADKYILTSVPFKGTPNCDADPTHIIKEPKEWWIKQFTDKGLKLIPTPNHFLFKEQILIFEK